MLEKVKMSLEWSNILVLTSNWILLEKFQVSSQSFVIAKINYDSFNARSKVSMTWFCCLEGFCWTWLNIPTEYNGPSPWTWCISTKTHSATYALKWDQNYIHAPICLSIKYTRKGKKRPPQLNWWQNMPPYNSQNSVSTVTLKIKVNVMDILPYGWFLTMILQN